MATLDNILIHGFYVYQKNTLIYNVPIITFSENGTLQHKIKIQGYKLDTANSDLPPEERIMLLQGKELLQDVDFSVAVNNTKDGIIITFFQNLEDVEIFECYRSTEANFFNSYLANQQSISLKQALETDINKVGYILQEHDKLIKAIRGQVDTYSNEITKRHKASEITFEPYSGLESDNVQGALEELQDDINEALAGVFQREAVRVFSLTNEVLTGVISIDGTTLNNNDRIGLGGQTNKGQNGIYVFQNGILTRSAEANSVKTIAGSQVRVLEGTYEEEEYQFTANNINGVLGVEPINAEMVFNAIGNEQIKLRHLAKQPANTLIANNTNTEAQPTYTNYDDIPVFKKTQDALDFKTDNSDFVNFGTQVQDILVEKQNNLPTGGDGQVLSWLNGQPENKTLTKDDVGLPNVDNTRDVDKPISNPQRQEFDKTFRTLGSLGSLIDANDPNNNSLDLNNLINLKQGGYLIPRNIIALIDNKPTNVTATGDAYLNIEIKENANGNSLLLVQIYVEQRNIQNQNTLDIKKYAINHYRIYNFTTGTFTEWTECATALDIASINQTLMNLELGDITGFYVSLDKHNADLLLKEDKLPIGLDTEYIRGDKTLQTFSTTHIIEGDKIFHTNERVINSTLRNYQKLNTATTENDTILEAIGKKADNNSPNFTGTPTAPTQQASDNSTKLATTEYVNNKVNSLNSKTTNGYTYLPNGIIMQWGFVNLGAGIQGVTIAYFPIKFPNACLNFSGTMINDDNYGGFDTFLQLHAYTASQANCFVQSVNNMTHGLSYTWFAIGF